MSAQKTSRKWIVTRGISETRVRDAIFSPPKNGKQQITVWVIENGKPNAEAFRLRLNVVEVYGGNRMPLPEQTNEWKGNFYAEGFCDSYPQLINAGQPFRIKVKISGWIGQNRNPELEILGIG